MSPEPPNPPYPPLSAPLCRVDFSVYSTKRALDHLRNPHRRSEAQRSLMEDLVVERTNPSFLVVLSEYRLCLMHTEGLCDRKTSLHLQPPL